MQNVITPIEMFYRWEQEVPEQIFLRQSLGNSQWQEYSWTDVANRVRRLATYIEQSLSERDLPQGSHIGIWSSNSADWVIVDLAIMLSGNVSVPLYPGQDCNSARYILEHGDVELLFVGAFEQQKNLDLVNVNNKPTVGMQGFEGSCCYSLEQVIKVNVPYKESPRPCPEEVLTIVYSSGTTGDPKGIMLSHQAPAFGADFFCQWLNEKSSKDERARYFSFLPMSHMAERTIVEMSALYQNGVISFSAGLEWFSEELRSVQPSVFFAVPRLWMKFKEKIDSMFPSQQQEKFGEVEKEQVRQQLGLAKALIIITGSAPLAKDIHQWFLDKGINIRDGYSMSETCALGACWLSDEMPVPGCVGVTGDGVELKITKNGEICFKTPSIMSGYYKNKEKTAEVIIDGWYHTGDQGYIDDLGNLWVTGRLGEIFKTSKGKFINPNALEQRFGALTELSQLLVFGHGKGQPLLLANLSESAQIKSKAHILASLEEQLARINQDLPAYQKVSQIFITNNEWTIDSGLLTPTLKIKRKAVENHYKDWIEKYLGTAIIVCE